MDRKTNFLWAILLIGLVWTLLAAQPQRPIEPAPEWLEFTHESGTEYIVRSKSIIGIISPTPGDPKKRNSIMLSNGQLIISELDLPDFKTLLRNEGAEVKSVEQ